MRRAGEFVFTYWIWMYFVRDWSCFGTVTVRTPFACLAVILSAAMLFGRRIARDEWP